MTDDEKKLLEKKLKRFSSEKTEKGCIEWLGSINYDGYGYFYLKKRCIKAHRASYLLKHGEIAKGNCICHLCDNRKCINIDHLWSGAPKDIARTNKRNIGHESKLWYLCFKNDEVKSNSMEEATEKVILLFKQEQNILKEKLIKIIQGDPSIIFELDKKIEIPNYQLQAFLMKNEYLTFRDFLKAKEWLDKLEKELKE